MAGPLGTVDRQIAELRSVHERIGQNLVELDVDVTRQMLQSSNTLRNRTAGAWAEASGCIENLWRGQLALAELLEQIAEARGTRSSVSRAALARLTELLDGPSLTLPRSEGRPSLTGGNVPTEQYTVHDAIARMSSDYDTALALVSAVGAVWTEVIPRLEDLGKVLDELETAADTSEFRHPNELAVARQSLADALDVARHDPLSFDEDLLESLPALVDRIAGLVRQSRALVQDALDELAEMGSELEMARRTLEAAERTTAEDAAKVLPSAGRRDQLSQGRRLLDTTDKELAACRAEARVDASRARRHLTELRRMAAELDELCGQLSAGNGGSVVERDELRGLLDAFRSKARAFGRSEDLQLDQLYREASDALYQAPCDLDKARALVLSYQHALRPSEGG